MTTYKSIIQPIMQPIAESISVLGGILYSLLPPCFTSVLTWFKGTVVDTIYLKDSAPALGDFLIQMVDGVCLSPDGVDTFTTATDHGTIVSYEGTSTLVYDGATVTATAGTFYQLLFSDGTFYPCIGKTNTITPTSTWATNGSELVIVSLDYDAVWAGVQQTYFYEVPNCYWEDVNGRYPYAHSGATRVDAGWHYPMNGFKYKEDTVGNFNLGDKIQLPIDTTGLLKVICLVKFDADVFILFYGNDGARYFGGSNGGSIIHSQAGTPVYSIDGVVVTSFLPFIGDGKLHELTITSILIPLWTSFWLSGYPGFNVDGRMAEVKLFDSSDNLLGSYNINEGSGTTITDSSGNGADGTLTSSDVPLFWSKLETPYAITQMDLGTHMYTNTDGESLTWYQPTLEELGAELQTNNHFTTDLAGYSVTTNWAWESPGVARHTTGSVVSLTSSITLELTTEYEITFTVGDSTAGTVTPFVGSGAAGTARSNGISTERLTCAGSTDFLLTPTTDFDGWVDNVSVREVDPLVNNNAQYYFNIEKGLTNYEATQTEPCLSKTIGWYGLPVSSTNLITEDDNQLITEDGDTIIVD